MAANTDSRDWSRGRNANSPKELGKKGWKDVLKRIWEQIGTDHITIVAAGVTFYGFLAVFPALAALVSLYGLVAEPATVQEHFAKLTEVLPPAAHDLLGAQMQALANQPEQALGLGLLFSVLLALWSAKKGVNALIEGVNIAYNEKEKRGFIRQTAVTMAFTLGGVILAIISMVLVVGLPAALGNLGLPPALQIVIRVVRWALLAALILSALSIVYRYAPSRRAPKWRWVTWGSGVATLMWLLASFAFSYYVSNFDDYNKTYGSLAAVVILLMWMFISSFIVLLGAEINSEMEHQTAKDSTVGHDRPMGERGAVHADTVGAVKGD